MKLKGLNLALIILAVTLVGCAQRGTPTSPNGAAVGAPPARRAPLAASSSETVNNYVVRFDGRTFAGGQTTFAYTVSGTGVGPPLNHFVIQLPPCAPGLASSTPDGGVVIEDSFSGLFGIKWGALSLGTNESRAFSITFPGDVPEGLVRIAVKAGETVGIGVLPGPCQGFHIAGTVYVDRDSSGTRSAASEPGILGNVTVALVDASGGVETTLTDANGRFSFLRLEGTYTVRVDAATAAADFNEVLAQSFFATGPTSVSVTVGPDANVDFGFKPRTRKLIADFENGILSTTGLPRNFWTKAFRAASRGESHGGFDATSLRALLAQIEVSFFPDPYQFTDGRELEEALAILTDNPRTSRDVLFQDLFVAELNDAAGKGIVGDPNLQDVLLSWGESLIVAGSGPSLQAAGGTDEFELASTLFKKVNNERGGGGGLPD